MSARSAALGLHSLLEGLLQNWMLDPGAFDLVKVGARVIDTYLAGLASPRSEEGVRHAKQDDVSRQLHGEADRPQLTPGQSRRASPVAPADRIRAVRRRSGQSVMGDREAGSTAGRSAAGGRSRRGQSRIRCACRACSTRRWTALDDALAPHRPVAVDRRSGLRHHGTTSRSSGSRSTSTTRASRTIAGCQPIDDAGLPAGSPAAYWSTLPIKSILAALQEAGITCLGVAKRRHLRLQSRLLRTRAPAGCRHGGLQAGAAGECHLISGPESLPVSATSAQVPIVAGARRLHPRAVAGHGSRSTPATPDRSRGDDPGDPDRDPRDAGLGGCRSATRRRTRSTDGWDVLKAVRQPAAAAAPICWRGAGAAATMSIAAWASSRRPGLSKRNHRREDLWCAGQHLLALEVVRVAAEVAHQAACLGHEQAAGGDVPGLEADLEECVEAAGSGVGHVERGCAGAADARPPSPSPVAASGGSRRSAKSSGTESRCRSATPRAGCACSPGSGDRSGRRRGRAKR